jgi:hypothetical protein
MNTELEVGTKVYYTGDARNSSGHFEIVSIGAIMCTLKEVDGDRLFRGIYLHQIGHLYEGHCNPRFVTEEARQTYKDSKRDRLVAKNL